MKAGNESISFAGAILFRGAAYNTYVDVEPHPSTEHQTTVAECGIACLRNASAESLLRGYLLQHVIHGRSPTLPIPTKTQAFRFAWCFPPHPLADRAPTTSFQNEPNLRGVRPHLTSSMMQWRRWHARSHGKLPTQPMCSTQVRASGVQQARRERLAGIVFQASPSSI